MMNGSESAIPRFGMSPTGQGSAGRLRRRRAFTLIELITTLSVGVIISGIAGSLVWNASRIRGDLAARCELTDIAAAAMEQLVRHVREIPQDECPEQPAPCLLGHAQISIASATELRFGDTGIRRSGTQLQISLDDGNRWHLVAEDVADFSLSYFDRDGTQLSPMPLSEANRESVRLVKIELRLTRGEQSIALRTGTYLRSFMNEVDLAP